EAIAEEVVGSAAKVLLLTGWSEAQIADLFEQAAQQLRSGEAIVREPVDLAEEYPEDDSDDQSIWGIADRFEQIESVRALNRLGKSANAIDSLGEPSALSKAIALVTEAISLRREALNWLRREAQSAGIEIVADHDRWTETATDEQLD